MLVRMTLRHDNTESRPVEIELDLEKWQSQYIRFDPFNESHVPSTLLRLTIERVDESLRLVETVTPVEVESQDLHSPPLVRTTRLHS